MRVLYNMCKGSPPGLKTDPVRGRHKGDFDPDFTSFQLDDGLNDIEDIVIRQEDIKNSIKLTEDGK